MMRRNQEKNSLYNQDDLRRRLSNGFEETPGERTDPPLLLDGIGTRNQTNGASNVNTISPRNIHRSSNGPTLRSLRRPRQFSLDSVTSSLSEAVPDSSFVFDSKPAARKAMRKSPTYPNCRQGSASLDRLKLPPALFSVLDNISKTIEIMPGLRVPLRGAKETWNCIEQDFFLPVTCFGCATELCCIQDASYVLCPVCRVVGPMDSGAGDFGSTVGVGLGFSFDDLFQWQSEIVRRQQNARPSCAGL
jgi:hypothetical protein